MDTFDYLNDPLNDSAWMTDTGLGLSDLEAQPEHPYMPEEDLFGSTGGDGVFEVVEDIDIGYGDVAHPERLLGVVSYLL